MAEPSLRQSRSLPLQLPCCTSLQKSWHLPSAQQVQECTEGAKSHGGGGVCRMPQGKEEQLPLSMQPCPCLIRTGHQRLHPCVPRCTSNA